VIAGLELETLGALGGRAHDLSLLGHSGSRVLTAIEARKPPVLAERMNCLEVPPTTCFRSFRCASPVITRVGAPILSLQPCLLSQR